MGLRALLRQVLSRQTAPSYPAPSVFGAAAERKRLDAARADEYEFAIAKEKGRPRGF